MIMFTQDKINGLEPPIKNETIVIKVPQTGKVVLKNWDIFNRDHEEFASYVDGTAIPNPDMVRSGQTFPSDRIGFWTLGTIQGTDYPQETLLRFIGTKAELDNLK